MKINIITQRISWNYEFEHWAILIKADKSIFLAWIYQPIYSIFITSLPDFWNILYENFIHIWIHTYIHCSNIYSWNLFESKLCILFWWNNSNFDYKYVCIMLCPSKYHNLFISLMIRNILFEKDYETNES